MALIQVQAKVQRSQLGRLEGSLTGHVYFAKYKKRYLLCESAAYRRDMLL